SRLLGAGSCKLDLCCFDRGVRRLLRFRFAYSNLEIGVLGGSAGNAGPVRATTEILQGQRVEPLHHLLLQIEPQRAHDLMAERAARRVGNRIFRGLEPAQRAHDVAEADAPPLAGETIAAARAANPKQDLVADQLLQHRLEVAARNALTLGYLG